ncbi:TIM-barrel domain-containing protein [Robinsoniella peoriensis]|uniref:TIM-barrel domain-containing protein n=1 Tax=Robinsoniella peoriensis TaxID=180332 RepID=UPI0005C7DE83|nr:TIM-barrel domain-containing protein [Robinsoniella peoriensis]
MIRKYTFGNPMETDAVVHKIEKETGEVPFMGVGADQLAFTYKMDDNTRIYGLGENVRGINKRGWRYISNCSDDPNHREEKNSLYAAHNFIIIEGKERFGLFFDYPGMLTFDLGYTSSNDVSIIPAEDGLDLYIIEGESIKDIVKQFRRMIGRSYIAPKWAFGYGQSRWSYMDEDEIREVVKEHRDAGIPLDSVYMDIDYMERYKDFTINEKAFPEFPKFVEELKEQNIHLVPIIDAGVKIEEGYDVYEEGVEKGYFCKEEDGTDFVAAVWPGKVHFPDMLNPDARKWFGQKYKVLLDQGIEGFWNDMNEPAIFYSEKHLDEVFEQLEDFKGKNIDLDLYYKFNSLVGGISNNPDDYKRFYHKFHGETVRHDKVHNLFGYNMTRAAGEAFEEMEPDKRILMFSRSSYVGMHRYGGIWTGDNLSWWSHLLLNIRMMPSLNMVGILYTGADIGGFGADTTEDLMMRWLEFGIFTPLFRNHSAMGTRRQEVYRFENIDAFKNIIGIRYGLLPYIYSEYMKAALKDEMYFRPLAFDYPEDDFAARVEDQLLIGDGLMTAPVYEQNAKGRYVYLPEKMKMVKMKSLTERSVEHLDQGHHYVDIDLDETVIFIRPNHVIPMSSGGQSVAEVDFGSLELLGYVEDKAVYELYDDDGYGKDYENSDHYTTITVSQDGTVTAEGIIERRYTLSI